MTHLYVRINFFAIFASPEQLLGRMDTLLTFIQVIKASFVIVYIVHFCEINAPLPPAKAPETAKNTKVDLEIQASPVPIDKTSI
jgi:hypothetical protein